MARGYDYLDLVDMFICGDMGDRLAVFAYSGLPIKYGNRKFVVYRYIPYVYYNRSIDYMIKLIKLGNNEVMRDLQYAFTWAKTIDGEQYWQSISQYLKNDYFHTLFLQIYRMSMRGYK